MSSTRLKLSEIFSSVQGEGPSAGQPARFLRLGLCNLRCGFCDTKYTWDFAAFVYEDEVHELTIDELVALLRDTPERRIVITGGEPLLQQAALAPLLERLGAETTIEVETNGTLAPVPALAVRVDQWNVSPKLAHSGEPEARRLKADALAALAATGRAYWKLVVRDEQDAAEAEALVERFGWPRERVLLMPEVRSAALYAERAARVQSLGAARGFGFSPRLHVLEWDGARGR